MRMWEAPPNWTALLKKLRGMPLSNISYVFWFAKNILSGLGSGRQGGKVWGPRFQGIGREVASSPLVRVCALQWKHCVEAAKNDLAELDKNQVFEIRYEDLIQNEEALRTLVHGLGISNIEAVVDAWRARLRPSAPKMWKKMSVEDQKMMIEILAPTLKKLGYRE